MTSINLFRKQIILTDLLTNTDIDPLALMRMRDRRDHEYPDYSLSAEEPQFSETEFQDKRAPKGFMGMRGKKASNAFYGVRGKKDSHNSVWDNEVDNNDDIRAMIKISPFLVTKENQKFSRLYNIFDWKDDEHVAKRVPSGFMGMRGRRAIANFYGVRGKRDISERNNSGQKQKRSALTKYIGIRGKKLVSLNIL